MLQKYSGEAGIAWSCLLGRTPFCLNSANCTVATHLAMRARRLDALFERVLTTGCILFHNVTGTGCYVCEISARLLNRLQILFIVRGVFVLFCFVWATPTRAGPVRGVFEQPFCDHGTAEYLRDHCAGGQPAALPQAGCGARSGFCRLQDAARVRPRSGQHRRESSRGGVPHRRRNSLKLVDAAPPSAGGSTQAKT